MKMEIILKHNFIPSVLMLGGAIVGFHYNSFKSGSCPVMVAKGESQTGKSTTIRIAMSLFGEFTFLQICHK